MTIGFDGSRVFGNNRTGTENYSYQLLKHLALIDHKNKYIVYLRPKTHIEGEWPSNFCFIVLNYPRFWTQVGLAKQTFLDKLDVLFVPSHTLPLIRRPGLKTVLTVHDLGAEYLPQAHQIKQRLYLGVMTHHQLKSATHLIAVSQATKEDIMKKVGVAPDAISVIHEGFNKNLLTKKHNKSDTKVDILKYYDIDKKRFFLFVGTIQPRKNLERLIKAYAAYLQNYVNKTADERPLLVLAGGRGWLSDEIYNLPEALSISGYVKFLGYVPDEYLGTLYSSAEALLFPSLFEGFGLPVLEAFACHCPVMTSTSSSIPEVAGNAAVYVDPYSVESISKGINEVANKAAREKLIKNGVIQLKKFDWKKTAIETRAVLEKIVSKG